MDTFFEDKNQREEILRFANRDGIELNGILHIPKLYDHNTIIIFTHSGVRGRIGNTRQYVYYARELAIKGYHVFRFDPHGMGYSNGNVENSVLNKLYRDVQLGCFVPDTLDSIDLTKSKFRHHSVVLIGLCGGAITALHAAAQSKVVEKVIVLSVPVRLERPNVAISMEKEYARKKIMNTYIKKMFNISAWYRLLTGKSIDFLSDIGSVRALFSSALSTKRQVFPLNQMFVSSMKKINRKKMDKLFFWGSEQKNRYEFDNEFEKHYPGMIKPHEKVLITDANHMFSLPCWQQEIIQRIIFWLES